MARGRLAIGMDGQLHPHLETGRVGEDAACRWYLGQGYDVVARNWRCRVGELDLVLERSGLLVFCEVKSRRGTRFGMPYEAVHATKQRKLRLVAEAYLEARGGWAGPIRFDVASVSAGSGGHRVHVFEDAF